MPTKLSVDSDRMAAGIRNVIVTMNGKGTDLFSLIHFFQNLATQKIDLSPFLASC